MCYNTQPGTLKFSKFNTSPDIFHPFNSNYYTLYVHICICIVVSSTSIQQSVSNLRNNKLAHSNLRFINVQNSCRKITRIIIMVKVWRHRTNTCHFHLPSFYSIETTRHGIIIVAQSHSGTRNGKSNIFSLHSVFVMNGRF